MPEYRKRKTTGKRKGKSENENEKVKVNLKEKVTELLDLPKEVVLDVPKMLMLGNNQLVVENFKGIIEYEDNRVRLNSGIGLIKIEGARLLIREITTEEVIVHGEITSIEFLK